MGRARAVRENCLYCSGGTAKEVTLCHMVDCPLWEYRFGGNFKSNTFKNRMRKAKERYAKDWEEMIKALETYVKHAVFSSGIAEKRLLWLKEL